MRMTRLGDLIAIKHGFAFLGEHFGDFGSHVVLTPGNFLEEGGFISKAGKEKWYRGPVPSEYVLRTGDLLVAMTEQAEGLLGSSLLVPEDDRYLHNQRLGLVQVRDPHRTDTRFLYYLFNHRPIRQQIRGSASGTKIRHTSPSRIADVKALVPQVAVQRRIASILAAYDTLIENCQRRIRILEDMARGLYREWFVHFRFPGADALPRVDSPLGPIPQGWDVRKLAEVAVVNRAQIGPRNAPPEIDYIDIASVSPGRIDAVTRYAFDKAPGRARRIVQHGDVLWSCVRPNRRSHAIAMHPSETTVASTGFAVLPAQALSYAYLYFATTTEDFVAYLTNHATGAAYPAVTAKTFEDAPLLVAPKAIADTFARFAEPLMEQAHTLSQKISNLRRTRDLLLPRLLSGQITLTSAEPDPASAHAASMSALV